MAGKALSNVRKGFQVVATVRANSEVRQEAMQADRRRAPRAVVAAEALVTSSRGESAAMTIGNISVNGCNITGEAAWLRLGGFVTLELAEGESMSAIVRWVRGESAGLEFLRPVPPEHASWHALIDLIAEM